MRNKEGEEKKKTKTHIWPIPRKNVTGPAHLFENPLRERMVRGTKGTAAGPFRTDVRVLLRGIIAP